MNQSEMYICSSLRLMMVPNTLMAKSTQRITTAMSMGHSNSAYSSDWSMPMKRLSIARRMPTLKAQRWKRASLGKRRGRFVSFMTM
jgi:hypothetical protein